MIKRLMIESLSNFEEILWMQFSPVAGRQNLHPRLLRVLGDQSWEAVGVPELLCGKRRQSQDTNDCHVPFGQMSPLYDTNVSFYVACIFLVDTYKIPS
jgi:hypothetical protein